MSLDPLGRCCGKKPLRYKIGQYLFCPRCNRSYNFAGKQISNWAFDMFAGREVSKEKSFGSVAVKPVPTIEL